MIISAMMNSSARGGGTDGCCTTLLLVLEARHLLLADGYDMSTHTVSAEIADPLASRSRDRKLLLEFSHQWHDTGYIDLQLPNCLVEVVEKWCNEPQTG